MIRSNHYEVAFESYLRDHEWPYLAIDETRRAACPNGTRKSADFVVMGPDAAKWVVDVKGRRFPGGTAEQPKTTWENWTEKDDLDSLKAWAEEMGPQFQGLLVFAYHLIPPYTVAEGIPDLYRFRGRQYLFRGIRVEDYEQRMRPRSRRWGTYHLSRQDYCEFVRPMSACMNLMLPREVHRS